MTKTKPRARKVRADRERASAPASPDTDAGSGDTIGTEEVPRGAASGEGAISDMEAPSAAGLGRKLVAALTGDFVLHGTATIAALRTKDPTGYLRAVASMVPKELVMAEPLSGITDEELTRIIAEMRARLEGAAASAAGATPPGDAEPVGDVPSVRKTGGVSRSRRTSSRTALPGGKPAR